MSSMLIPRRRKRAAMRMASSSEVVVREVAKRKWSTSSSPRNIPKWVCVFPTSIVRSIGSRDYRQARDPLNLHGLERPLEPLAIRRIQLQQWLENEPALEHRRVRQLQQGARPRVAQQGAWPLGACCLVVDEQDVDVERARRMPRRVWVATQLELDPFRCRQQRFGVELGLAGDAGVVEVLLTDGAVHRLGLVHV